MGEVYRARDDRLGRDVAIKVIPATFARDPDRMRRFEAEARAAGQLSHPNVLAIYDVGAHEGSPFIVSELLDGETLRERLARGPMPMRKVIDVATQVARGLAAAHDARIVHRDLKPENLFITRDERVKILDFGLAKLNEPEVTADGATLAPTMIMRTEPGTVMGTPAYMSPEQVRAEPLDHRSDIFSFGAILHEMASSAAPFRAASLAEIMAAIVREETPELAESVRAQAPGFDRIVHHCLEKKPGARWQDARDLTFALENLSGSAGGAAVLAPPAARPVAQRWQWAAALATIAVAAAAAFAIGRGLDGPAVPSFQRLTFGRGTVWSARFTPEGGTIVYSASWDGKPVELYSTRPDGPESRRLGISCQTCSRYSPGGAWMANRPSGPVTTKYGVGRTAITALMFS